MMSSKNVLGSIGFLILLSFFFIRFPVISFEFKEGTYYTKNQQFDLIWIHSVEKEEWIEMYQVHGNQLILEETKFKTFGAGVPSDAKEVALEDGYVVMTIDQPYDELNLTISENVSSMIKIANKEFKLYEYGQSYDTVQITAAKINLWEYLKGEFL
jgi:hypothetical protein